jgi:hypothetical protein
MIVGYFSTPLSLRDRSSRPKKSSEINDTIGQMDLKDIYRSFCPSAVQYTFFSAANGNFSKKIIF